MTQTPKSYALELKANSQFQRLSFLLGINKRRKYLLVAALIWFVIVMMMYGLFGPSFIELIVAVAGYWAIDYQTRRRAATLCGECVVELKKLGWNGRLEDHFTPLMEWAFDMYLELAPVSDNDKKTKQFQLFKKHERVGRWTVSIIHALIGYVIIVRNVIAEPLIWRFFLVLAITLFAEYLYQKYKDEVDNRQDHKMSELS